jgi:hypothetical protein
LSLPYNSFKWEGGDTINRISEIVLDLLRLSSIKRTDLRKSFLFLALLSPSILFAQKHMESFVRKNTFQLSASSPDSMTFSDLEVIGSSIAGASIVMLGEQDHGDAPTFLAKTRLIKYLHEKKGFNVIAFESDFFGLNDALKEPLPNELQFKQVIRDNLLSLWSFCNSCDDLLYNYIPSTLNTSTPISVTGFDNQVSYVHARKYLVEKLDSVLHSRDFPVTKLVNYKTHVLPLLEGLVTQYWHKRPADSIFSECGKILEVIKQQARNRLEPDSFWSLILDNLISFNSELHYIKSDLDRAQSIRDEQMYKNLKWLVKTKYANQKVIVWAANCHVLRDNSYKYKTMGTFLSDDTAFAGKVYTIGFTSFSGESGRLFQKKYKINKPKNNSFENWINPGFDYAFVDFTAFNNEFPRSKEKFELRHWNYISAAKQWNHIFDGIYYIKTMYACENNLKIR